MSILKLRSYFFGLGFKAKLLVLAILISTGTISSAFLLYNSIADNNQPEIVETNVPDDINGEVAGVTETVQASPSQVVTAVSKNKASPTPYTQNNNQPANNNIQNTSPSPNYTQPVYVVNPETSQSTTSDAYIDYLHQWQDENAKNLQKCTEWSKKRDETLAPLKSAAEEAKRKFDEAVTSTENSQLTSSQKSRRISHLYATLGLASSEANLQYLNALNNYGTCPYI